MRAAKDHIHRGTAKLECGCDVPLTSQAEYRSWERMFYDGDSVLCGKHDDTTVASIAGRGR